MKRIKLVKLEVGWKAGRTVAMKMTSEKRRTATAATNMLAAMGVVAVLLLAAGDRADATEVTTWSEFFTDSESPLLAAAAVSRSSGTSRPVAAVSRSSAAVATAPRPAFAVARGGVPASCLPGNCVSNQAELIDAIANINTPGGLGGVITLCRDAPIVIDEDIIISSSFLLDPSAEVTIECCDVTRRTSSSTLPRCSIVTGPDCAVLVDLLGNATRVCSLSIFNSRSLTLSGILFDGSSNTSPVPELLNGIVRYRLTPGLIGFSTSRITVVDCVFQNVEGSDVSFGVTPLEPKNTLQLRALNVFFFGGTSDPEDTSLAIEIVRTAFFDNPSGGLLLFSAFLPADSTRNGNINALVRDSQFERNGQSSNFVRFIDNSGIAVLGPIASITVDSSRFIDNLSAGRGGAIQIERDGTSQLFPIPTSSVTDSTSVTLRGNLFRGNRCGPSAQFAEAGAVYVRLEGVIDSSVTVVDSDFIDNAAVSCNLPGTGCSEVGSTGGGLVVEFVTEEVIIDRCRFKSHTAEIGAAIFVFQVASLALTRSKIEKNVSIRDDGIEGATAVVEVINTDSTLCFDVGTVFVSRSTFKKNTGTHTSVVITLATCSKKLIPNV